jgi:alkanesulfonate monooxygenase SsuD/methylene tetrahydromethanopterin reductase-like flavin-dependent oxidoreductase (luciferase family)
VGLGAGHSFTEYRALGLGFDPPTTRKERLAEAVLIIRSLLDGHRTTFRGRHYEVEDATVMAPRQNHVPILVGVNGREALAQAARHADVVAPTMLGRTLPDGQHHEARWEASRLDATISWVREATSEPSRPLATGPLQVHALVQAVVVTDERERAAEAIARRHGLSVADALETPFLCIGDHVQMAEHLVRCRERWGIEYYTVRSIDDFAPVMRLVREAGGLAG